MATTKRRAKRTKPAKVAEPPELSGDMWTTHTAHASAYGDDRHVTVTLETFSSHEDEWSGARCYIRVSPRCGNESDQLVVATGNMGLLLEALTKAIAEARRSGILPPPQ